MNVENLARSCGRALDDDRSALRTGRAAAARHLPSGPAGGKRVLPDWLLPARPVAADGRYLVLPRPHWLSGNLEFVDALVDALDAARRHELPVFTDSLRDVSAEIVPVLRPGRGRLTCSTEVTSG